MLNGSWDGKQLNQPKRRGALPPTRRPPLGLKWASGVHTQWLRSFKGPGSHWGICNKTRWACSFSLKSSGGAIEGDGALLNMSSVFITSSLLVQQHKAFVRQQQQHCVLGLLGSFCLSSIWEQQQSGALSQQVLQAGWKHIWTVWDTMDTMEDSVALQCMPVSMNIFTTQQWNVLCSADTQLIQYELSQINRKTVWSLKRRLKKLSNETSKDPPPAF